MKKNRIAAVYKFDDGCCAVYDGNGNQIPKYCGRWEEKRDIILADKPDHIEIFTGNWNERSEKLTEQTIMENLRCELTEDELKEATENMAKKIGDLETKEADKKEVMAQIKADIEAVRNEIAALARMVRNKSVYREVEVKIHAEKKKKIMVYTRQDTGEVIRERAMTPSELQTELKLK